MGRTEAVSRQQSKVFAVLRGSEISEAAEAYGREERRPLDRLRREASENAARLGAFRMPLAWAAVDLSRLVSGGAPPDQDSTSVPAAPSSGASDSESLTDSASFASGTLRRLGSTAQTASFRKPPPPPAPPAPSALSLATFRPAAVSLHSLFRAEPERQSEAELYKLLADARKPGALAKKLKTLPAKVELSVSPFSEASGEVNLLSPHLLRCQPFDAQREELAKELVEFPARELYAPHQSYRNLFYATPRSVNLSGRPGSGRNVAVRVELMMGATPRPLRLLFGPSSGPQLTDHIHGPVLYHNKAPETPFEVKGELPVELDETAHLLFTFSHVTCKAEGAGTESALGWAWLPLLDGKEVQSGDFALPVALDALPPSYQYLSPQVALPGVRWLDNHKPAFSVSLRVVSSVHPDDGHLAAFLRLSHEARRGLVPETELLAAIRSLSKAKPEPLVRFLYPVLDQLLGLLVAPPALQARDAGDQAGFVPAVCLEMLGQLVKILTLLVESEAVDEHQRSGLLTTYLTYHLSSAALGAAEAGPGTGSGPSAEDGSLLDLVKSYEAASSTSKAAALTELGYRGTALGGGGEGSGSRSGRLLHEALVHHWLRSTGAAREMAFANAWFFLELMVKSMGEHVGGHNRTYLPRKMRFSAEFVEEVKLLVGALTAEVVARAAKDPRQARHVNSSLAFFLRDALSLMDRSLVFGLLRSYLRQMAVRMAAQSEISRTLWELRLETVRLAASHEHFVVLSLPWLGPGPVPLLGAGDEAPQPPGSPCPSSASDTSADGSSSSGTGTGLGIPVGLPPALQLSRDFQQRHWLVGLVLGQVAAALPSGQESLQRQAAASLLCLLRSHELDPRYGEASGARGKVAALYLPLLGILLDHCGLLHDPHGRAARLARPVSSSVALAISGHVPVSGISAPIPLAQSFSGASMDSATGTPAALAQTPQLSLETTKDLLLSLVWVLKCLEKASVQRILGSLSTHRLTQLLDILQLSISCWEYRREEERGASLPRRAESARVSFREEGGGTLGRKGATSRAASPPPSSPAVRWRRGEASFRSARGPNDWLTRSTVDSLPRPELQPDDDGLDALREGNLSSEVAAVVLDVLQGIRKVSANGASEAAALTPLVLRVLLHSLARKQSTLTVSRVMAMLRSLILASPAENGAEASAVEEATGAICQRLLSHAGSPAASDRAEASGTLYLLMRQAFTGGARLARVKVEVTVALSELVSGGRLSETFLRKALRTLLAYSEADSALSNSFGAQVSSLVFNLHMILADTVAMADMGSDFEMLMDRMQRIAKGYQSSPDLRLTWLGNMGKRQRERGNTMEAAMCALHSAALAAEYVGMLGQAEHLPRGAAAFLAVSENVVEESAVSEDVLCPKDEAVCASRHFSEEGLLALLEDAAELLYSAQLFESLHTLAQDLLLPILGARRDYKRVAALHSRLAEAMSRLDSRPPGPQPQLPLLSPPPGPANDKRVFGTFFRVGFYGAKLGDLDGAEFVYKEAGITKLAEISHRLLAFYSERLGEEAVELLKDSSDVRRERLSPDKAYIQVTFVEPYEELWEARQKRGAFEKQLGVRRFLYSTPFTADGAAHAANMAAQQKRKTVVETEAGFPYLKTRLRVVRKEQWVLSPIEVALEDVQAKTAQLHAALRAQPLDPKMLQMVLQGSMGTTVNQGPLEVAKVFLAEASAGPAPLTAKQNKLRLAFKAFSKACADALRENKRWIGADQREYQRELERNYLAFTDALGPVVGNSAPAVAATKLRHRQAQQELLPAA